MKGIVLRALIGAGIGLALASAARADDDFWSRLHLRLPTIVLTPHPAPDAPDLSTCLMICADRNDACLRGARTPARLRDCRLRGSLCSGDCDRYGIGTR